MTTEVKILADSVNETGDRLTSFQVRVPRVNWAEVMTHRAFSRNASSNRAIPIKTVIQDVIDDPYIPERFGLKQRGMQPKQFITPQNDPERYQRYVDWWLRKRDQAVNDAKTGDIMGLHKQVVNRLLEPFQYINAVISATEWDNFIRLRTELDDKGNPMADIPIYLLAQKISDSLVQNIPTLVTAGNMHIPFAGGEGWDNLSWEDKIRVAVARCARVSYVVFDMSKVTLKGFDADLSLYYQLEASKHMSPMEHVALAKSGRYANYIGWQSYRNQLEGLCDLSPKM